MKKTDRLAQVFDNAQCENRAALIGYITAGDPDAERSFEIIDAACRAGLDVLELGVPCSDPTSDGPVIQRAMARALRSGMTLAHSLTLARRLRERHDLPIILLSYYSPIVDFGVERFVTEAMAAGVDGTLVVDIPHQLTRPKSFAFIHLITPNTDAARRKEIVQQATGFVYVISRPGVTGNSSVIDWNALEQRIDILREEMRQAKTSVPLCVGFGISRADDAQRIARIADGVVIGSAIQSLIEDDTHNAPASVAEFVRTMRKHTIPESCKNG
ncbi:MAG: tryptophan synthase subunit alpha [Thermoguttaceae bacterium]